LIIQPIIDLVALCHQKGIKNVILSPGSRCAPLTLAFARHPGIITRTISDERSAAFIALGMAQALGKPVALVCTSGSAAMNYFPAIAEAFFQQIPLLIITADRPPEWINQYDGQTVFQAELYGEHVKKSYRFPDSFESKDQVWHANRISNEAINLANQFPPGPIHLNIPLREPFYPKADEKLIFPENLRNIEVYEPEITLKSFDFLQKEIQSYRKILIIPGQQIRNTGIQTVLDQLSVEKNVVIVTDTISNLQSESTISLHDHWLGNLEWSESLQPDLILTFGKSIISKSLKLFARKSNAAHWHIQEDGKSKDTFQKLSKIITSSPISFLEWLLRNTSSQEKSFAERWNSLQAKTATFLASSLAGSKFGEYSALHIISKFIPENSKIHVANSMSVRYLNFLGKWNQEIYCNRGTSGIDGSNSTAVGCALVSNEFVTLITGDLAFFYDRNAFWHNYQLSNLRIILLNNHAGGIFRLIEGPSSQPELEEFFETKQALNGTHLAAEFGFEYNRVNTKSDLEASLENLYSKSSVPKLLEIESNSEENARILDEVKARIKSELSGLYLT
jgi:2-succinyl-5-enolpyruvyl-6-hydroxy-3-cyclohexene-1-carboxylate synthase